MGRHRQEALRDQRVMQRRKSVLGKIENERARSPAMTDTDALREEAERLALMSQQLAALLPNERWDEIARVLDGLLRALAAPSPGAGWADIASAPKDGTRVLLRPSPHSAYPAVGHWAEYGGRCWYLDGIGHLNATWHPTEWAPLPAAPTEAGEAVRPVEDWHEDFGPVVWWTWLPDTREWLGEPSYIGSPLMDDWPGYHTHWTPHPATPAALSAHEGE